MIAPLAAALPGRVVTDPAAMEAHRRDQCLLTPAGHPLAVVHARETNDVVTTLRFASEHGIAVVPRGCGTGLAGGANALDGSIVLSVARMDQILAIDPDTRLATVEPGVLNGDLDTAARAHGLTYPPDPGSRAISSIGGNIATNAGGMCCAKYGVTADHVAALTAVLADGRIIRTGSRSRKDVAGLDLTHLLVGSEGTLAVVVEATVRLRPAMEAVSTVVAAFTTTAQAVDAVIALRSLADPMAAELMDHTTIESVEKMTRMGLDTTAGALLLVQFDGPAAATDAAACVAACAAAGATEVYDTDDHDEGAAFMEARRAALPALERRGTILLDDVAVAVPKLPRLLAAIEEISDRHEVVIGTFGHAADGNLHPTIVHDPADADEAARARLAFDEIVAAALGLGGTVSGEHGVGALKTRFLDDQLGSVERELMHRVKHAFDPAGLLNPGRGY